MKKSSCLGIKGDVNAIGRVHSYLESLGIINLGAVQMPTPPSKTARSASPPAKEKPVRKETKPKSNRWTKAKEARAAKKEKELQREREKNEREERKKKEDEGEGDKEEKEDSRKTAWQTRREEASFDAGLEKERRKRKSARTEACLSKDGNQDTAGGYCGGSAVMCLMLPLPERITRFRAMEVLQVQQQETRRLQDRRSTAANRSERDEIWFFLVAPGSRRLNRRAAFSLFFFSLFFESRVPRAEWVFPAPVCDTLFWADALQAQQRSRDDREEE